MINYHLQRAIKSEICYVKDVVSAYLKLIEYGSTHNFLLETFELGTGQSTEIREFCERIKLLSNSPTQLAFGDIPYRVDEIMDLRQIFLN